MIAASPARPAAGGDRLRPRRAAVRERTLVTAGVLLICIHVVDDRFLQPQPGTSAGDHLVSGLVPLAVLLLAAALYPRLRGSVRAAVAAVLGVFGIVAGVEAAYYTMNGGPSGDDYTGLLSIAAGFLLVSVGAVTLWTTRRPVAAFAVCAYADP